MNASGSRRNIGVGLVHGSNACLADSLLQGLAAKGILNTALLDDTSERSKACRAARQHLILHEDYRLRPLVRDHLASVVLDDDVDHNNAFLEHDVHSEALVLFFFEYVQSTYSIAPKGFKVGVYTRFDAVGDPLLFSHTFGIVEEDLERGEPVVLELYNNTGETITGYHYDPVFMISDYDPTIRSSSARSSKDTTSSASGSRSAIAAKTISPAAATKSQQPGAQPPPLPHDAPRPAKSSSEHTTSSPAPHQETKGPSNPDLFVAPMYSLACVSCPPEDDQRSTQEHALDALADQISQTPTLPWSQRVIAQCENSAIDLPTKHCAFTNCSWSYRTSVDMHSDKRDMFMRNADDKLAEHLLAEHHAQIDPVASALTQSSGESEKSMFCICVPGGNSRCHSSRCTTC